MAALMNVSSNPAAAFICRNLTDLDRPDRQIEGRPHPQPLAFRVIYLPLLFSGGTGAQSRIRFVELLTVDLQRSQFVLKPPLSEKVASPSVLWPFSAATGLSSARIV